MDATLIVADSTVATRASLPQSLLTYARKSVNVGAIRLLLPDGSERVFSAAPIDAVADSHTIVSKSLHRYHDVDLADVTIQLKIHDLAMFPRIVFGRRVHGSPL